MLHAEDGYTPCHNEYVSGDAREGKIASNKPSILCDPLVSDPSHSSKIAGDQVDDSKQGVAQYSNLRIPTDHHIPSLADERGTKRLHDSDKPGIEELFVTRRRSHRP